MYLAATWDLILWACQGAAPLSPIKWDDGKVAREFTRWDTFKLWLKAARARLDSRIGNYMTYEELRNDLKSRSN